MGCGLFGFARTSANPDHQSAKLYQLTAHGQGVTAEVDRRQNKWAEGLAPRRLATSAGLLQTLCEGLEADPMEQETPP